MVAAGLFLLVALGSLRNRSLRGSSRAIVISVVYDFRIRMANIIVSVEQGT
jgi:hypothetical protein